MPDRSTPVKLGNESALGLYPFAWISGDGTRMGVMWGEGMTGPMAFRGKVSRDVVRPERFGWKPPRTLRDFKAFAQAFADEFEAGYEITADSPADLGPEGERLAREERWTLMTVEGLRAQLRSQIAGPVVAEGMTRAERRAEMDRWLADCQAQSERLDEEHRLLWIGRSAAICMTHELTGSGDRHRQPVVPGPARTVHDPVQHGPAGLGPQPLPARRARACRPGHHAPAAEDPGRHRRGS